MKSTWDRKDSSRRRNLLIGFLLFVLGIGISGYCGYMERYAAEPAPDFLKVFGLISFLAGLGWFLLGILQSPIRRP